MLLKLSSQSYVLMFDTDRKREEKTTQRHYASAKQQISYLHIMRVFCFSINLVNAYFDPPPSPRSPTVFVGTGPWQPLHQSASVIIKGDFLCSHRWIVKSHQQIIFNLFTVLEWLWYSCSVMSSKFSPKHVYFFSFLVCIPLAGFNLIPTVR